MKHIILGLMVSSLYVGCSTKEMTYSTVGTAIGAGVGYSFDHDDKEAVIGGLAGGIAGSALGKYQHKRDKKKGDEFFEKGYKQAKLDLALNHWNENTGRQTNESSPVVRRFVPVKIPEQNINGINYESHIIKVEDYQ